MAFCEQENKVLQMMKQCTVGAFYCVTVGKGHSIYMEMLVPSPRSPWSRVGGGGGGIRGSGEG